MLEFVHIGNRDSNLLWTKMRTLWKELVAETCPGLKTMWNILHQSKLIVQPESLVMTSSPKLAIITHVLPPHSHYQDDL